MGVVSWTVGFTGKARKQYGKLSEDLQHVIDALVGDLTVRGPAQPSWKHYGRLRQKGEKHHCHLKSGRPTYVACWEVIDKRIRILEIYYVGTHEGAPY
jgi:mRNA-degrading endonuclease RelE of RelBE toxin-antitoxin system